MVNGQWWLDMLSLGKSQHKNNIIFSLQFQVVVFFIKSYILFFPFIVEALVMIFSVPNEANCIEVCFDYYN